MGVLLTALAVWLGFSLVLLVLAGEPERGTVHTVRTDDGWTLRLERFEPPVGVQRRPAPVILGHGITMSARCWLLSQRAHVPRMLAAGGHDVWVAEYRGRWGSRAPSLAARIGYTPEDLARRDLPAIIDGVRKQTGAAQVSWVGHSMGGMLAYLYAAEFGSEALHRVVTLGAPARFGPQPLGAALPTAIALLDRIPLLPSLPGLLLIQPLAVLFPWLGAQAIFQPAHLGFAERAALMVRSFRDEPSSMQRWFAVLKVKRASVCPDEPDDPGPLPGGFCRLTAPLLVVASVGDRVVLPRSSRAAFDRAASPTKLWRLHGDPTQSDEPWFGHNDLICSAAALRRVYPLVRAWLERDEPELDELVEAVARGAV